MIPQKLSNETRDIGKPVDWNEEIHGPCESLSVHDYTDNNGLHWMVSSWKPTNEELEDLINGSSVQLSIAGLIHPVVSVWVPDYETQ